MRIQWTFSFKKRRKALSVSAAPSQLSQRESQGRVFDSTRKDGTVTDEKRKRPPLCHSDGHASGVEESTTLDNEPPQDKPSYLGRFLDSLRSLGMTCTMGSTSAPIVSTTYNAAPPLIHRLRAVPLPRWGRPFWSFPGAFHTSFNGRTEMTNVGPPNNCPLSNWT